MFFLGRCVGGGAWGVDGGWMPLPTHPQRYCDPASLVPTKMLVTVISAKSIESMFKRCLAAIRAHPRTKRGGHNARSNRRATARFNGSLIFL